MGFRLPVKYFKKRWRLFLVILCLTAFHNECLAYWFDSIRWPSVSCSQSDSSLCQTILIVSDPQILGPTTANFLLGWIGYIDSDRYLEKSFYHALKHTKPDVVVFLGDLMDQGSASNDEEYASYKARFSRIFDTSNYKPKIIYLPGDNDIGGEGNDRVTRAKIQRFNKNFPSEVESYSDNIQFVIVNRIIGDFNLPSVTSKNEKYRVVLSHIPLTFVPGIFSREVMNNLKPNVIFSAHDHRAAMATSRFNDTGFFQVSASFDDSAKIRQQMNDDECFEIIWPTCSYRMGVEKAGYGFATIGENGKMEVGVLWIHSRFWSLYVYLVVIVLCLGFYLLCRC